MQSKYTTSTRKETNARRFAVRFWARVDTSSRGCWHWTGQIGLNGYGRVWTGERVEYAHRAAWRLAFGTLPSVVCHRCDNRVCCRPSHLFGGEHRDNQRDMWAKGRGRVPMLRGTRIATAKLDASDVRVIRAAYAAGGVTQRALAARFGVTQALVQKIVCRLLWRHVE